MLRFLYTYNFYIIPDPDFYFQKCQRINPNCLFDGVSSPDLTVAAVIDTTLQRVVFRMPGTFFSEHQEQPFTDCYLWDAEMCVSPSFFFFIRALREIHHIATHIWAGINLFNQEESQGLIYCRWEGKENVIPLFSPSNDLSTALSREPRVLHDLMLWWTCIFLLWLSWHTPKLRSSRHSLRRPLDF